MTGHPARGLSRSVRLQGILFDYGGTLDGPASHWLDRFAGLYRELGIAVEHGALKAAFYGAVKRSDRVGPEVVATSPVPR